MYVIFYVMSTMSLICCNVLTRLNINQTFKWVWISP